MTKAGAPNTQEEFAKLVNISQPEVSKLIRKGTLTRGATTDVWLKEYLANLRSLAAQWKSDDGIDRVREAALLDRTRREALEIELAKQRGDLWARVTIETKWEYAFSVLRSKVLSLPSRIRSVEPQLSPKGVAVIEQVCTEILTELANEQFPASTDALNAQYFSDLHAAAETNGQRVGGQVPDVKPGNGRRAR